MGSWLGRLNIVLSGQNLLVDKIEKKYTKIKTDEMLYKIHMPKAWNTK